MLVTQPHNLKEDPQLVSDLQDPTKEPLESNNLLELLVFNNRPLVLLVFNNKPQEPLESNNLQEQLVFNNKPQELLVFNKLQEQLESNQLLELLEPKEVLVAVLSSSPCLQVLLVPTKDVVMHWQDLTKTLV